MRIAAVSDIHCELPNIPACDLLLLAGDFVGFEAKTVHDHIKQELKWYHEKFSPWLEDLSARGDIGDIVATPGNHDFIFQHAPELVPPMSWSILVDQLHEPIIWDSHTEESVKVKIYGSPWQRRFGNYAFNLDEVDLYRKWSLIPDDVDILVLHSPPYMYGDLAPRTRVKNSYIYENCGSPSLSKRIEEIQPKLVVYGHIHNGYGQYKIGNSVLLNCAYCGNKGFNPVQIVDIDFK